jgi:hypothetical protein
MEHECGLCLRDNSSCMIGKSFWELLFGKVKDCSIYEDYHKGLVKEKIKKINKKDKGCPQMLEFE